MGSTQLKSLSTCQLCAEKWTFHTASSKVKPDLDNSSAENSAPLLPSTKSTTNTSKTWLKLLKLSGLTTMRGLKKLGNTGVVESWVLNLKLRLTRAPGPKLWQRVRR